MPPDSTVISGGCRCGSVRYRAREAPLHSMICHCQSCRRSAGAPLVPWVTFRANCVEFHGIRRIYPSSPGVERSFCPACGTPLSYTHTDRPEHIDVLTCTLDTPEAYPPQNDSWLEDDLPWMRAEVAAARPGYRQFRTDGPPGESDD